MKKTIMILVSLCMMLTLSAQDKLFSELSETKGVTSVVVNKTMLSLVPSALPDNISGLVRKLDKIEIYTSENKSHFNKLFADLKKTKEVLMEIKEDGQDVKFYGITKGEIIEELIMCVGEQSETVVIRMLGKFTAEDLQKIISDK